MASPNANDLRRAPPSEVLAALESTSQLSDQQLRAVLANAVDRIATLEREWDELGRIFRWFNEQVDKSSKGP